MQRQAVPLLKTDAPLVGTGMELRGRPSTRATSSWRRTPGRSRTSTRRRSSWKTGRLGRRDDYELQKFMRSNEGTLIHQTTDRRRRLAVVE